MTKKLWMAVYAVIFLVLWFGLFFYGQDFLGLKQWQRLSLMGVAVGGLGTSMYFMVKGIDE